MKRIQFFIILSLQEILNLKLDEDGYPDVQDLFPIIARPQGRRAPDVDKSFDFDIEKIDVNKLQRKMETFAMKMMDNETAPDTRRQKVPLTWRFSRASQTMLRAKTLDLMLQIIYMGRHVIQTLEGLKHFSITDTGYRIAFTYSRLRRLWRRMMDQYTFMANKIVTAVGFSQYNYNTEYMMMVHLKAIKYHTDFLNLWWVLINLDGKYTMRMKATTTTVTAPTTRNFTTIGEGGGETKAEAGEEGGRPTGPAFVGTPKTTVLTKPPKPSYVGDFGPPDPSILG
ncbi:hypothetical protein evm_007990 [Chilo suppressalis]|nr:hypothetical protein evm_007990 [Chilo suppressalis]